MKLKIKKGSGKEGGVSGVGRDVTKNGEEREEKEKTDIFKGESENWSERRRERSNKKPKREREREREEKKERNKWKDVVCLFV